MTKITKYQKEIIRTMNQIGKLKNSIFLGQSVLYPGNLLFGTLKEINRKKIIEMPIVEETQLGMSIGLSLSGYLPVSCFPRFDFLLLAMNQLVNHLDKIPIATKEKIIPKVIIRVIVGAKEPLDAGLQHTQNYTKEFKSILHSINVYSLDNFKDVNLYYKKALNSKYSSILVEHTKYHYE